MVSGEFKKLRKMSQRQPSLLNLQEIKSLKKKLNIQIKIYQILMNDIILNKIINIKYHLKFNSVMSYY